MNCSVEAVIGRSFDAEFQYSIPEIAPYVSRQTNSWSICYGEFRKARKQSNPDYDLLALHLGFYLASWGMYRGSSFLKALDYRIHYPAVKMMLEDQYRELFTIDPLANKDRYWELLFDPTCGIYCRLNTYYGKAHAAWPKSTNDDNESVTDTLITKILLGVYGCIPAYDINFKEGVACFDGQKLLSVNGNAIWKPNGTNNRALLTILENATFKAELKRYAEDHDIPFMKAVDMYFFGLGFDCIVENARKKKAGEEQNAREEIETELATLGYIR